MGPDAERTTVAEEQAVDGKAGETGAAADSDITTTDSSITESTSAAAAREEVTEADTDAVTEADTDAVTEADTEVSGDEEQTTSTTVTEDGDTKIVYPTETIDTVTTVASPDKEESTTPSG